MFMAVTARDSDLSDYKRLSSGTEMSMAAFIESTLFAAVTKITLVGPH